MLDSALKQVVAAICKPGDGFKVKIGKDSNGQLQAIITRGAHKIELQGRYGQNTIFKDGSRASFVSYTVRAEGGVATLDRAENAGESVVILSKIIGVVVGVAAVCPFMGWLMLYSVPLLIGAGVGGKWLGEKAGRMIIDRVQAGATKWVLNGEDIAKADAIWERLTSSINSVTSSYPAV